jgi:hypothetical protein
MNRHEVGKIGFVFHFLVSHKAFFATEDTENTEISKTCINTDFFLPRRTRRAPRGWIIKFSNGGRMAGPLISRGGCANAAKFCGF